MAYVKVCWPDSQEIMSWDGFDENSVALPEPGAYLVDEDWLNDEDDESEEDNDTDEE